MRHAFAWLVVLGVVVGLCGAQAFSGGSSIAVSVKMSPSTIALRSKGTCVTAHVGIRYSLVAAGSVELNGLSATSIFADDRGYLVAKFSLAAVKGIVSRPTATLTLTGATKEGDSFSGSDTVRVR